MTPKYLVDASAVFRLLRTDGAKLGWDKQIRQGLIGVCPVTELELLFTARSKADRVKLLSALERSYPWVLMPDSVYDRARQVQELLTQRGEHRSAGPVDLLVAATAELSGLTLLHYDRDFETISAATGQPSQWLAKPGTIP